MKSRRLLAALAVVAASCVSGVAAEAEPRYRILAIVGEDPAEFVQVSDLNDFGLVVGTHRPSDGRQHAFRWRDGELTDLHGAIAPDATSTAATSVNEFGTIVGDFDFSSRAFRLRGTTVTPVTVAPGETFISPFHINNRGQMVVESSGGAQQGIFFVDGASAEVLPGFPGGSGSLLPTDLNDRGVVVGSAFLATGQRHAALWRDGVITDLGVPAGTSESIARGVNNWNRVVGDARSAGSFSSSAATWRNGVWTSLPPVLTGPQSSSAEDINDWGLIVGSASGEAGSFAALWLNDQSFIIDDLVSDSDPLKPFVQLVSANFVNNRGDIVAIGFASSPVFTVNQYFLRLVDE